MCKARPKSNKKHLPDLSGAGGGGTIKVPKLADFIPWCS